MKTIYGVEGVTDLFTEDKKQGVAAITKFTYDDSKNPLYNLRAVRDGGAMFYVHDGDYIKLHVNNELIMSDTGMERYSNKDFINAANGRVLIAGLGIGLILKNILYKPEVTEIVIIEKYQDVIDLVAPVFKAKKIKIICADIFEYDLPKTEKFDTIYFDIWARISEDNLEEMKVLHSKFRKNINTKNPDRYINSWMKQYLQKQKRNSYSY